MHQRDPARTGLHLSSARNNTSEEVASIQYLRAAAAMLVAFTHTRAQIAGTAHMFDTSFGLGGVDIFFVISGFVMMYTTSIRSLTPFQFLYRRAVRIVPLYWIFTFFTAALLLVSAHMLRNSKFTVPSLIWSLLFIPAPNPGEPDVFSPMLKLGWTLNYEMFFYLMFACFLWISPWRRVAAIGIVFFALVLFKMSAHPSAAPLIVWGDLITLEFLLGCAIACLYLSGSLARWPGWIGLTVGIAAFIAFGNVSDEHVHRFFFRGIPAALIVASLVNLEMRKVLKRRHKVLHFLGDASYSIYLTHIFPVVFFRLIWHKLHLPDASWTWSLSFVLLCLTVSTASGCLVHVLVEKPVTRFVRARTSCGRFRLFPYLWSVMGARASDNRQNRGEIAETDVRS